MLKSIRPQVTELGKIKIGRKEEQVRQGRGGSSWQKPEKLDHFLITTLERDKVGNYIPDKQLMEQLVKLHGSPDGKLREIPIALLSDDVDEVLLSRHCLYAGRQISASCDEEVCTYFTGRDGNALAEPVSRPCNGEHEDANWKTHSTFNCVIALGDARMGGVYKFRTTSIISLEQLYGCLVHLQQLTGGVLQGLPLRMVVRPKQVAPEGKPSTVYVVHVELRGVDLTEAQKLGAQLAQLRLVNARQIHAARAEYMKLLAAPGEDESPDEQEAIATEFHPPEEAPGATWSAPAASQDAAHVPDVLLADPARTAPAPVSEIDPAAVYEQSQHVANEAPQDRQVEQPQPPAAEVVEFPKKPVGAVDAGSPLAQALDLVSTATDGPGMRKAFKAISALPAAEKKRAIEAYTNKQATLAKAKNGTAHA